MIKFLKQFFHKCVSPKWVHGAIEKLLTPIGYAALLLLSTAFALDLWWAPTDYQQGDAYRIMFVHVPAAFMSLFIYVTLAVSALVYWVWHIKLANVVVKASAPIGAWLTLLALVSGALWGKPMWGTFWIWDARLTSELLLLFLYLGLIILRRSIEDPEQGSKVVAVLALLGAVDLPIIHYSVYWWNTLHQRSTLLNASGPTLDSKMLYPLLGTLLGFLVYYVFIILLEIRSELWVRRNVSTDV